jgi:hypothetical protein
MAVPLLAYVDLYIFGLGSSLLQFGPFDLNHTYAACVASNFLCLLAYFSTKAVRG